MRAFFDAPRAPTIGIEEELMLLRPGHAGPGAELRAGARRARRRHALQGRARRRADRDRDAAAAHGRRRGAGAARGAPRSRRRARRPRPRRRRRACIPSPPRSASCTAPRATTSSPLEFAEHRATASSCSACTCTSRSAARSGRSRCTTRCAPICPTSRGSRPTRRSTRAATAGLASVRPTIAAMLPRQGVPPALGSWEAFERALSWGESGRRPAGEAALVVGAAAASDVRHDRGARRRHADDGRRDARPTPRSCTRS